MRCGATGPTSDRAPSLGRPSGHVNSDRSQVTDMDAVSAAQLMAARETEAQFWRHPSFRTSICVSEHRSLLENANRSVSSIS